MNLHILPVQELIKAAADYVSRLSSEAVTARGRFTVAVSGGSLPGLLFPLLTTEPYHTRIDWEAWHVFWADERCVPLTDPNSNYYSACKYLFNHSNIPPAQIYAPDTSLNPADTASTYQSTLCRVFKPTQTQLPRFDLILLGMGEDGHTASLFPCHPILEESNRWVAHICNSPKPPPDRITLTLPIINNARQVAFFITGAGKAGILHRVLDTKAQKGCLPAQMIQPAHGELHWFVDEEAAAFL